MMLLFTAGFLVLLTVLLMERYYDSSRMRNWSWVEAWHGVLEKRFAGKNDMTMVFVLALPPALLVLVADVFLRAMFYGVLGIVLEWFVLLYCLGPRSLWQDVANWQQLLAQDPALASAQQAVEETSFVSGLWLLMQRRIAAPLIWCVCFGVAGAFLYRLVEVSARVFEQTSETRAFARHARRVLHVLDWLPSRIITLLFALSGHFALVMAVWRQQVKASVSLPSAGFLTNCGNAGLGLTHEPAAPSVSYLNDAMGLFQRSLVFLMAFLGLLALISW